MWVLDFEIIWEKWNNFLRVSLGYREDNCLGVGWKGLNIGVNI